MSGLLVSSLASDAPHSLTHLIQLTEGSGSGIQTMGIDMRREAPQANKASGLRINMHCSIVIAAADD